MYTAAATARARPDHGANLDDARLDGHRGARDGERGGVGRRRGLLVLERLDDGRALREIDELGARLDRRPFAPPAPSSGAVRAARAHLATTQTAGGPSTPTARISMSRLPPPGAAAARVVRAVLLGLRLLVRRGVRGVAAVVAVTAAAERADTRRRAAVAAVPRARLRVRARVVRASPAFRHVAGSNGWSTPHVPCGQPSHSHPLQSQSTWTRAPRTCPRPPHPSSRTSPGSTCSRRTAPTQPRAGGGAVRSRA